MAFLFPIVITYFPKTPVRTESVIAFAEDVQDTGNWIFIGTVFSISTSIISMATSQTSTYFAAPGKGPFIKDVINQGGGGVCQKMILLNKLFSKNDDEGGWGVKNLKKLMKSFMNGP